MGSTKDVQLMDEFMKRPSLSPLDQLRQIISKYEIDPDILQVLEARGSMDVARYWDEQGKVLSNYQSDGVAWIEGVDPNEREYEGGISDDGFGTFAIQYSRETVDQPFSIDGMCVWSEHPCESTIELIEEALEAIMAPSDTVDLIDDSCRPCDGCALPIVLGQHFMKVEIEEVRPEDAVPIAHQLEAHNPECVLQWVLKTQRLGMHCALRLHIELESHHGSDWQPVTLLPPTCLTAELARIDDFIDWARNQPIIMDVFAR